MVGKVRFALTQSAACELTHIVRVKVRGVDPDAPHLSPPAKLIERRTKILYGGDHYLCSLQSASRTSYGISTSLLSREHQSLMPSPSTLASFDQCCGHNIHPSLLIIAFCICKSFRDDTFPLFPHLSYKPPVFHPVIALNVYAAESSRLSEPVIKGRTHIHRFRFNAGIPHALNALADSICFVHVCTKNGP